MNSPDPWSVMQSGSFVAPMVVPDPYWGHPFLGHGYPQGWAYGTSPAWDAGLVRGTQVFVGAVPVSRAIAPATGAVSAIACLDPRGILHAAICADGEIHAASIDLRPAIDELRASPVSDVAVDRAVAVAADALVGALIGRRAREGR